MRIDRRNILKLGSLALLGAAPGMAAAMDGSPGTSPVPRSVAGNALSGQDLIHALRSGGFVVLMRHASSPRTPPEAAQSNPDNPDRERQLDETGRASARALGEALRRLQIPVGPVYCSPTYRALETARLAGLPVTRAFDQLGDEGRSMQSDTSGQRGAWLRSRVSLPPPAGRNTLIITHFPNIAEAFAGDAGGLEDGESLIFHTDGHGGARLVARVKITEWPRWANLP